MSVICPGEFMAYFTWTFRPKNGLSKQKLWINLGPILGPFGWHHFRSYLCLIGRGHGETPQIRILGSLTNSRR